MKYLDVDAEVKSHEVKGHDYPVAPNLIVKCWMLHQLIHNQQAEYLIVVGVSYLSLNCLEGLDGAVHKQSQCHWTQALGLLTTSLLIGWLPIVEHHDLSPLLDMNRYQWLACL